MHRLFKTIVILITAVFLITAAQVVHAQSAQFRGPNRDGVFPETGLLKQWPKAGPQLRWVNEKLDPGYASPSVTEDRIYLTGRGDDGEYLIILDLNGTQLWRIRYGLGAEGSYPEARCTPTVEGDKVYVISGRGEVACISKSKKAIVWSAPALDTFKGEPWRWEIAESPLVVDDKVIFTPGGNETSMVALDKETGKTVWTSASLGVPTAFVSPILVERANKKIIVGMLTEYLLGVDASSGKILWQVRYSEIAANTDRYETAPFINCVTPLYHDGHIFVTSGYDHAGVMFKLSDDGASIEQVWVNKDLDNHHGQVVRVGKQIYGSNWINNRKGNWCCVDWDSGKTLYETEWHNKGPISAADGLLFIYDEKGGNLGLAKADPAGLKLSGSFEVDHGSGPHWSQPVIKNGIMYIRHGEALMAYDVKGTAK